MSKFLILTLLLLIAGCDSTDEQNDNRYAFYLSLENSCSVPVNVKYTEYNYDYIYQIGQNKYQYKSKNIPPYTKIEITAYSDRKDSSFCEIIFEYNGEKGGRIFNQYQEERTYKLVPGFIGLPSNG